MSERTRGEHPWGGHTEEEDRLLCERFGIESDMRTLLHDLFRKRERLAQVQAKLKEIRSRG